MSSAQARAAQVPAGIQRARLILLLAVLALTLLGLVMVYSAGSIEAINEGGSAADYALDQLRFALVGIVCAVALWKVPSLLGASFDCWRGGALLWFAWGLGIVLLALTWVMGESALGAQRWLQLGPIGLQPSEFAKVSLILMTASIYADFREGVVSWLHAVAKGAVTVLLPMMFIFITQTDLGTTIIIAVGVMAVFWLGELDWKFFGAGIVLIVAFGLIAIFGTGYRSDRMLFLNPWDDGEGGYGDGYQIIRSWYALSEGGIFGVGLGNSHEKYLYLPEAETDFIFAVVGEELGMVGALVVIALFLAFLWAGMYIAHEASGWFATMMSGGLTLMIVFQAFLNIAFVIGVFPTTGKPLPFISSGGSSLIATFIMVGLILAVSEDATAPDVHERRRADLRVVRMADAGDSASAGDRPGRGFSGFGATLTSTGSASRAGSRPSTGTGTRGNARRASRR